MTRIALISDIHANEVALRAVLAEVFRNLPPGGFHFASSRQLGVAVDGPLSLPRARFERSPHPITHGQAFISPVGVVCDADPDRRDWGFIPELGRWGSASQVVSPA
jgi:hypothetical protein